MPSLVRDVLAVIGGWVVLLGGGVTGLLLAHRAREHWDRRRAVTRLLTDLERMDGMTTTKASTHTTSRDCHHCGGEIALVVTYEVDDRGTPLILDVDEPACCAYCGQLTDGPDGSRFMRGLQEELREVLRAERAAEEDARRAKGARPWD
jgi:hypothetical protein